LREACADMAWWFGWPPSVIDGLTLEEFEGYQKEAARQIKAGYRKGF